MPSRTKEHKCRDRVHRKMPPYETVRRFPMGGTLTNGVWDFLYAGLGSYLWVEWKWTEASVPRTLPDLTPAQRDWGEWMLDNGARMAVIEGCPIGYRYYYHGCDWLVGPVIRPPLVLDPQECAHWIEITLREGSTF